VVFVLFFSDWSGEGTVGFGLRRRNSRKKKAEKRKKEVQMGCLPAAFQCFVLAMKRRGKSAEKSD